MLVVHSHIDDHVLSNDRSLFENLFDQSRASKWMSHKFQHKPIVREENY